MSCDCHLEMKDPSERRVLTTLLVINAVMFGAEFAVGLVAQSTGVLADSLDMLADALVYGVALYAVGRGAATRRRAAMMSGIFQLALAAGILFDIARRAVFGSEPSSLLMFAISCGALAANAYCLTLIARHKHGEVHMRASYIFSRNDVIANAGVILASGLVFLTHSRWPDLAIGLLITAVVMRGGWDILAEARREEAKGPA